MNENLSNLYITDVQPDRFDRVIEWLLISLLVFMPLAFGAVEAWSEEVVVILAGAVSICFLLKLVFQKEAKLIWSWAYIPVALFIFIAVLQLIPLRTGLINAVSPGTAAIKKGLLDDMPNSGLLLKSMTLSFYPNATAQNLRLVLAVTAVFFVIVNTYRRPDQIKRLLGAIAVIGGSIAVLSLAQSLFGTGKIYWLVPSGYRKAISGTFIHHSHYGQFMNLSIGAALGLVLVKVHEAFSGRKVTPPVAFEYLSSRAARRVWYLVVIIIIGAATIFISLTRGGMVSMLVAAGFTTLVLSSRRSLRGQGWVIVLMALGAFICILYMGFDAVYDRLATLQKFNQYEDRLQIIKDVAVAWTRFPVFGTGLGTHEVVYPMFDRSTIPALAAYAENEYAQAAEETGLVGLAALLVFGILVWKSYFNNVRSAYTPIRSAAYGLGFGLLAIMIHSLSDFGQHLPANAMLSAIFCALLLVLTRIRKKDSPAVEYAKVPHGSRSFRVAVLVCAAGVWAWILLGANNVRLAEASWKKALVVEQRLIDKNWQAGDEEYTDLISNAAAAVAYQPDNVKYQHWLNVYRWKSISRLTDPRTGEVIIPERAMDAVNRIVDELHKARLLCPTYGATYCVVGQLEKTVLNDPKGAGLIRKGFQLAPCDTTTCFVVGLLDAEEQKIDAAFDKLNRAVELDGGFFKDVADVFINHLNRPDLALAIAGDNIDRLSCVADGLADLERPDDVIGNARAKVIELLKQKCSEPDAPALAHASLANIYRSEKDNDAAIEHYRRALELDDSQVKWRFALASLLADAQRIPEAIREAKICLYLSPGCKAAERMLESLSDLSGMESKKENRTP
jgi:tetratricopeptide (TPR) repeat protein